MSNRRLKIYCVREDDLLFLFARADRLTEFLLLPYGEDNLPADAEVVRVHYCFSRQCLTLCVHSASFEIVPDGEEIPLAHNPRVFDVVRLKRRSVLETHEPDTPEDAAKLEAAQASWRDRGPLL